MQNTSENMIYTECYYLCILDISSFSAVKCIAIHISVQSSAIYSAVCAEYCSAVQCSVEYKKCVINKSVKSIDPLAYSSFTLLIAECTQFNCVSLRSTALTLSALHVYVLLFTALHCLSLYCNTVFFSAWNRRWRRWGKRSFLVEFKNGHVPTTLDEC